MFTNVTLLNKWALLKFLFFCFLPMLDFKERKILNNFHSFIKEFNYILSEPRFLCNAPMKRQFKDIQVTHASMAQRAECPIQWA